MNSKILIFIFVVCIAQAFAGLDDGVLFAMDFNNDINDTIGNFVPVVVNGTLNFTTGLAGQAVEFNKLWINTTIDDEFDTLSAFTMSMLVKPDSCASASTLWQQWIATDGKRGTLLTLDASNHWQWYQYYGSPSGSRNIITVGNVAFNCVIGRWYLLTVTYTEGGNIVIYGNATNIGQTAATAPIYDVPPSVSLGAQVGTTSVFDGLIDELVLWNRTLNTTEIADWYAVVAGGESFELCEPNWTCSGYGACNESDLRPCNAVVDNNSCGDVYSGDYTEFAPQACDFCETDWSCSGYASCNTSDLSPCNETVDGNSCGEVYGGDYSEFMPQACNYCSRSVSLLNTSSCVNASQILCYEDANFATCCDVTQLASDCYDDTVQNESIVCEVQGCSTSGFEYSEGDLSLAVVSTLAKTIIAVGLLVTLLVISVGIVMLSQVTHKK